MTEMVTDYLREADYEGNEPTGEYRPMGRNRVCFGPDDALCDFSIFAHRMGKLDVDTIEEFFTLVALTPDAYLCKKCLDEYIEQTGWPINDDISPGLVAGRL